MYNADTRYRVKDWLYGITKTQPQVDKKSKSQVANDAFEAESILSVYHLLNWSKDQGGAGITPGLGNWKNVKSIFPIHNEPANRKLLKRLSKKLLLNKEDLDEIRNLFGSQVSIYPPLTVFGTTNLLKVAFYFAYMQTYLLFLTFPAVTGIAAWAFLPKYSLVYAVLTLLGCTVFLEYWKILQADLSIRWDVKSVAAIKVNRPKYKYEKTIVDASGRTKHYYPKWKSISRQFLQIPFFVFCLITLGAIITLVFAIEVLVSEAYHGPYQQYLVSQRVAATSR